MLRCLKGVALAGLVLGCLGLAAMAEEEKKPMYTIKEVMKKAMKGGLCVKVAKGAASDDEKKELVMLFTALGENKPPKGDADDWKERTTALVVAAKDADSAKLKKAANCMGCHSLHKGK